MCESLAEPIQKCVLLRSQVEAIVQLQMCGRHLLKDTMVWTPESGLPFYPR